MTRSVEEDILLLKRIRSGDEIAFKYLFDTYFTSLCRFMYVYINDKPTIEESVLDIFVYVWENRDTLQIQLSFKAYLFQAARNKALNMLRQKKQIISLDEVDKDIMDINESSLEEEELYHLIQAAISELPEKCREIFLLSRNESLTNKEISEKLNISTKTIEAQITKALKRIKKYLGDSYSYLW